MGDIIIFTTSIQKRQKSLDQSGINMVDLMMWLVIAALLLAAAIQGIGYYKKTALVYQLSADASGAGQNIMAASSGTGSVTEALAQQGIDQTKTSKSTTILSKSVGESGHFIVIASSPDLPDYDVVYSSETKGGLNTGVNLFPKGSPTNPSIMLPERGAPVNNKCSPGQWKAEYYNNLDHTGTPVAILCETRIAYNWGAGVPYSGLNPDQFSVRWSTSFDAPVTKMYNIQMNGDDGSRVKIDGVVVAGTFSIVSESYSKQVSVNAGTHDLVVEYHENGGAAAAHFNFAPVP